MLVRCCNAIGSAMVALLLLAASGILPADETTKSFGGSRIEVQPTTVEIAGRRGLRQLVVTGYRTSDQLVDLTRVAKYQVLDSTIAGVSATGQVRPLSDGTTELTIEAGGQKERLQIHVTGYSRDEPVSFDYHVLPVLARAGCSTGSCHGSPHGKAGFRLSLFASDPSVDRQSLLRDAFGRRVNRLDPAESLLLQKPVMRVPHGGGKRLSPDSLSYRLLYDWIDEGCSVAESPAQCLGIEVFPSSRVLTYPSTSQQFGVLANFSDGSTRDVTHLASYSVSDPSVAEVTKDGRVAGLRRGESAIIVRFRQFIETPLITFARNVEGFRWKAPPSHNYVDRHIDDKLKQLQYLPSEICNDETFVRRVYLDVIGILPTPAETKAFLADKSPNKRSATIDALLERPEYALYWAQKWGDLLRVSRKIIGAKSVFKYNRWLQSAVSSNMPYDQFVRELLMSSGSTLMQPSGNYFRAAADTNDAMETTAQLFVGTRIQCAKCHNHPFERWTQDNYYGLAAVFGRVIRKKTGRPEEIILWSADEGEVVNPRTGQPAQPWVPNQGRLTVGSGADRREAFVNWLTSLDNPFFARVEVNRIWSYLMGRGIVEPFDDFRDSNPPANSRLLDALARDFVVHKYDRKHMMRTILRSRTYQASSRPNDFNRDDNKYFSHYLPRRLSAEQLVDALGQVTDRPRSFTKVAVGTKATWLPAPDLPDHDRRKIGDVDFLKVFGQPERQSVCECERGDGSSLGQALELLNGKFVHTMLSHPEASFKTALAAGKSPTEIVDDLYRRALCRSPLKTELQAALKYIDNQPDKSLALEDVCWAILNKKEFLFQH